MRAGRHGTCSAPDQALVGHFAGLSHAFRRCAAGPWICDTHAEIVQRLPAVVSSARALNTAASVTGRMHTLCQQRASIAIQPRSYTALLASVLRNAQSAVVPAACDLARGPSVGLVWTLCVVWSLCTLAIQPLLHGAHRPRRLVTRWKPIILVGCKKDLRCVPKTIEKLRKTSQRPATPEQGMAVAQKIGAKHYLGCSAKTREVFQYATLGKVSKKKKGCLVL